MIIKGKQMLKRRNPTEIAQDLVLANQYAKPGTVKHFALRLGFLPSDEKSAESILEGIVQEWEDLTKDE